MRVLHIIPTFRAADGGPTVALRDISKGLVRQGVQVHILTTYGSDDERRNVAKLDLAPGVKVYYCKRSAAPYTISFDMWRWLLKYVGKFDLVHIHCLFTFPAGAAAAAAKHAGVPYIIRPLGTLNTWSLANRRAFLKKLSIRLVESRIISQAAAIHFTSRQEQEEATHLTGATKSVVLPLGFDIDLAGDKDDVSSFRSTYPLLQGKTVFLSLSRIAPKKGLDLLLPAFAKLKESNTKIALVIAGDGDADLIEKLHLLAAELGITEDIVWTGFLAGPQKQAALAGSDVFVLPSYSENFGVAVVEAMAAAIPVIVSDQVGLHDDIAQNGAGLVVSCDVAPLSEAMALTAADESLRHSMGENGRRLARDRFSLDSTGKALADLYGEIVGRRLLKSRS